MLYTLRFFFSSKCSLFHNANFLGSCIIHILYTVCAEIKKNNSHTKGLRYYSIYIYREQPNKTTRNQGYINHPAGHTVPYCCKIVHLCMPWRNRWVQLSSSTHSETQHLMEVIGLLHPQGENLFNRELGGPQSQSGYFTEVKKQLPLLGNKLRKLHNKIWTSTPFTVTVFKGLCNVKKKYRLNDLPIRSNQVLLKWNIPGKLT